MRLKQSPVAFDEAAHSYTLNGKQLRGVTKMIRTQLFADEYANVPDGVLMTAAEKGKAIHAECQLYDTIRIMPDSEEGKKYVQLCEANGFLHEESEYLVSDEENFASSIDKVYRVDDNTVDLADIKTTYRLNAEYARWQLSIYAYLFEMQNPDIKVRNLIAIWLHGDDAKAVPVARIDESTVKDLMAAELAGQQFYNTIRPMGEAQLPDKLVPIVKRLQSIMEHKKQIEHDDKVLRDGICRLMAERNIVKFTGSGITITRIPGGEEIRFDSKALKEADPETYALYTKTTKKSSYLKIAFN